MKASKEDVMTLARIETMADYVIAICGGKASAADINALQNFKVETSDNEHWTGSFTFQGKLYEYSGVYGVSTSYDNDDAKALHDKADKIVAAQSISQNNKDSTTPEKETDESSTEEKKEIDETKTLSAAQTVPDSVSGHNIADMKDKKLFPKRNKDAALVNHSDNGTMSFAIRDGQIMSMAASKTAAFKMDNQGQGQEIILEKEITTNKFKLNTKEIIVNAHKLNRLLYDYTDYQKYLDQYGNEHVVGNLCIDGTIMVKAWDATLKKNMLIRRPARFQMFGNRLNVPEINGGLGVEDLSILQTAYKGNQESVSARDWYNTTVDIAAKQKLADEAAAKKAEEDAKNGGDSNAAAAGGSTDGSTPAAGGNNAGGGKASSAALEQAIQMAIKIANDEDGQKHSYVKGGGGPVDFDCTGFVSYTLNAAGFNIMVCHGNAFDENIIKAGFTSIPWDQIGGPEKLQRGDILSNASHVAYYIGNNQVCHASTDSHPQPDQVKVGEFYIHSNGGWKEVFRWNGK